MQDLVGPAMLTLGLTALGGYLLGSIPFGVIITRAAGAGDVRNIGSGNIGATNVLRTGRKDLALATLLLDAGKGAAALLIARPEIFVAGGACRLSRDAAVCAASPRGPRPARPGAGPGPERVHRRADLDPAP